MKPVPDQSQRAAEKEILEGSGFTVNRDDACAIWSQRGENMKNHKIYPAMLLIAGLVATPVSAQGPPRFDLAASRTLAV